MQEIYKLSLSEQRKSFALFRNKTARLLRKFEGKGKGGQLLNDVWQNKNDDVLEEMGYKVDKLNFKWLQQFQ